MTDGARYARMAGGNMGTWLYVSYLTSVKLEHSGERPAHTDGDGTGQDSGITRSCLET